MTFIKDFAALTTRTNFALFNFKTLICMNNFFMNQTKAIEMMMGLEGAEIKMIFAINHCLKESGDNMFINNAHNRNRMAKSGFSKTPERISCLLSSLVKKGILVKEGQGIYTFKDGLFLMSK